MADKPTDHHILTAVADLTEAELLVSHASAACKMAESKRLQQEVALFLSTGGKIEQVAPNMMADPPKRPENNYGSQPI